jgi:hypothetical protein
MESTFCSFWIFANSLLTVFNNESGVIFFQKGSRRNSLFSNFLDIASDKQGQQFGNDSLQFLAGSLAVLLIVISSNFPIHFVGRVEFSHLDYTLQDAVGKCTGLKMILYRFRFCQLTPRLHSLLANSEFSSIDLFRQSFSKFIFNFDEFRDRFILKMGYFFSIIFI